VEHRRSRVTSRALPLSFSEIISKTLRKDREERYQSASELLGRSKIFVTNWNLRLSWNAPRWAFMANAGSPNWLERPLRSPFRAAAIWLFRRRTLPSLQFNLQKKVSRLCHFWILARQKDQEYFCDGISEEILEALAKIDGIRVVPAPRRFQFKGIKHGRERGWEKAQRRKRARGKFATRGNAFRITTQLINDATAFRFGRKPTNRIAGGVCAAG